MKTSTKNLSLPLIVALLALGAGAIFLLTGCERKVVTASTNASTAKTLYTCGMHPQVVQDHPGTCPICEMKLTPIKRSAGGPPEGPTNGKVKYYKSTMNPGEVSPTPAKDSMGMEMVPVYENEESAKQSAAILIDPVTTQNMGIRTSEVTSGPLNRSVRTVGVIDYDESMRADVTTKFKGWIEKLYVDANGAQVHRGEPLFEIYSPELYSAQTEYLLALSGPRGATEAGNSALKQSARQKLRFFDISDEQIAELEKTRQPRKTLPVASPIDGFVIEKTAVEGMMAEPGMTLYRLADLGIVWVYAQVYEQDLPFIKLGQEATVSLTYMPGRKFRGRVTYIYPDLDPKTRTARVRMEFHNPGFFLKPGMYAAVQVSAELAQQAVLVPESAVLRSGEKDTVFLALGGGKFEPRPVTLGVHAEDARYQVLSGLKPGDRVVTSGQFMLDSESQMREAIQKMLEPDRDSRASGISQSTNPPANSLAATDGPSVYVCPMPEHVSIEYQHPGKCPICGMSLVPVPKSALKELQPGGKVLFYTCPMPEHNDVHSERPGKCPHCGMTLIPVMSPPPSLPEAANVGPPAGPAMNSPDRMTTTEKGQSILYTCPMESDADVVSDHPGKCPKCGMALVPTNTVGHGRKAEEKWRAELKTHGPAAPSPR